METRTKIKSICKRFAILSKDFTNGIVTKQEYLDKTKALSEYLKENKIPLTEFVKMTSHD